MYARLARYEVPADRTQEVVRGFEGATGELEGLDGLAGGYLLVDEEEGQVFTLTLWESRAALEASAARAGALRQRAVKDVEGSVLAVNNLDVALSFGATEA